MRTHNIHRYAGKFTDFTDISKCLNLLIAETMDVTVITLLIMNDLGIIALSDLAPLLY